MGENIKGVMKNAIKSSLRRILPIIMIAVLVLVILAAMDYAITLDDGIYKEGDMSSTPYAASTYINSITVEKDGTLKSEKTAQELWDEMIKNGSRVDKYLSTPKELARLMKAEIVTQYPDTRKDPDKEIDWDKIKKNEDLLQGIVKFKRASDGQTAQNATTMSYVDPATFQGYIEEYNNTGSQTAKENALKHFTLKETTTTSVRGNSAGIGSFEKYTDLTEDQLKALATVSLQEQGAGNGAGNAAELSLMVNLYEREKNNGYTSVYDYVKRSGWFANAASYMDSFCTTNGNGSIASNPEVLEYARIIFVQGKRTLPGYVDEHDCTSDIAYVTNDGASIDKNSPSQYVQFKSIIHQGSSVGSGQWTYYCHPTPQSDPFGYTSEERRAQIGELYYEFRTWKEVNGNGNSSNSSDSSNKNNGSTENNNASVKDEKTDVSQAILDAINKTPCPGAGLCLKWVDDVYENAGLSPQRLNSAYDSYKANGISTDRNNIPIGAAVYGTGTGNKGPYGHVGIYIGDGKVVDNVGSIKTQTLDEWISWQENYAKNSNNVMTDINGESQHGWLGWGWADGNKSRGTSGDTGSSSETTSRSSGKGYVAVIATWSQTDTSLTSNDPNVSGYSSTVYSMTTTTVNYQSMVEKYTMPFDFLWALLVVGEEKDFVFELADLVFESDIQVTIYDNLTVNTNVDNWHYDQQHKTQADIYITATSMGESASRNEKNHEHESLTPYRTTKTVITQNNTVNAILTRANTWIVDYKNEYTYNQPTTTSSQNTVTQDDQQYPGTPDSTGTTFSCELTEQYKHEATAEVQEKVNAKYKDFMGPRDFSLYEVYNVRYYSRYINIADDITSTTETRTYTEGTPKLREKTSKDLDENGEPKELNFVTIFRKGKHITARKNITSVPEWLFEIVETNGKPDLDLVKYLLYKATGKDYGVTQYDFSEYDPKNFTNIDGDYGDWDGTGSNEDFIKAVAPYAVIDMQQHNIYASVTIAQAIIESGWGKDNIAIKYKNFFGMKAFSTTPNEYWSGERVLLGASEGGSDYFKVYDSLKNSIYDHGRNFHVTQTYGAHGVLDCISQNLGPKEQLRRIAISGYAVYRDGSISKPDGQRTYDVYLYEEFIAKYNLEQYDKMSPSDFEQTSGGNSKVVEIAKKKLGCPYVYGAAGPNTFDCSGLVQWVYQQVGISLPRTTYDYKPYIGTSKEVSWDKAQPGDIVWKWEHMGIYLGNDQYLHAPHTGDVVKISSGAKGTFTNVFRFTK